MDEIKKEVENLYNKDANSAYQSLKKLISISENTEEVSFFMEEFIQMMENSNSYIRMRGIALFSANAKWDEKKLVNQHILDYLSHMEDEKPITARQCIQQVHAIARYKPEVCPVILEALERIEKVYQESMQPLLYKDRQKAIRQVKQWMAEHEERNDKEIRGEHHGKSME